MEHALAVTRDVDEYWWVDYERILEQWRLHGRFRWEDFPVDKRFALTAGQREGMFLAWIQENVLLRRSQWSQSANRTDDPGTTSDHRDPTGTP
jgi:hypothetical protein